MPHNFVTAPSMDKRTIANEVLLEDAATLMNEGRDVMLTPLGSSMLPFIRGGKDSVRLRKMPDVSVGDIDVVLYRRPPESYVLHRVIERNDRKLTLMGDGNIAGTEACSTEDVMGSVVGIVRNGKERPAGKGRLWQFLKPVRRYILAIYRRLP